MRSTPSLSRRWVLLVALMSPALLGAQWKCVAVSNPTAATARIERLEPTTLQVGEIIQAAGRGGGAAPLQFAWDFGDGTLTPGMQAAHAYLAPGTYRVTLTVRDALGNTARDFSQVAVLPRVASSVAALVLVPDAVAGQAVVFTALASTAHASALTYEWTFSDGQSAAGPQVSAIFPIAGTYFASITVTDDLGATAVAQVPFEVRDAAL